MRAGRRARGKDDGCGPRGARKKGSVFACLTPDEWQAIWRKQGGKCAICLTPVRNRYDPSSEGQAAYTEHDHKLEKTAGLRASIRGLACLWCNRHILVALHDSADKAQRAADYLRDPPARGCVELC